MPREWLSDPPTAGIWLGSCPSVPVLTSALPLCDALSPGRRDNSVAVKAQTRGSRSRLLQTVLVEH